MKTIAERLAKEYRQSANESAGVIALHDDVVGDSRSALLMLMFAVVGIVVLIACANVANLLLVRGAVRDKEIAIRTALGAARRRLVLQMLAESLVLALAGGAVGLLLAYGAITPIGRSAPEASPGSTTSPSTRPCCCSSPAPRF